MAAERAGNARSITLNGVGPNGKPPPLRTVRSGGVGLGNMFHLVDDRLWNRYY